MNSINIIYQYIKNVYLFCLENVLICNQQEHYCTFRVHLGNLILEDLISTVILFLRVYCGCQECLPVRSRERQGVVGVLIRWVVLSILNRLVFIVSECARFAWGCSDIATFFILVNIKPCEFLKYKTYTHTHTHTQECCHPAPPCYMYMYTC